MQFVCPSEVQDETPLANTMLRLMRGACSSPECRDVVISTPRGRQIGQQGGGKTQRFATVQVPDFLNL